MMLTIGSAGPGAIQAIVMLNVASMSINKPCSSTWMLELLRSATGRIAATGSQLVQCNWLSETQPVQKDTHQPLPWQLSTPHSPLPGTPASPHSVSLQQTHCFSDTPAALLAASSACGATSPLLFPRAASALRGASLTSGTAARKILERSSDGGQAGGVSLRGSSSGPMPWHRGSPISPLEPRATVPVLHGRGRPLSSRAAGEAGAEGAQPAEEREGEGKEHAQKDGDPAGSGGQQQVLPASESELLDEAGGFRHSALAAADGAPPLDAAWQGEGSVAPTRPGEKPRVVVLGSGWAACRLIKDIDTKVYDIAVVSPRNHMVFTPLLASTCVGTLEFRSVAEPVEAIQPAVSAAPSSFFFLGRATGIDPERREVFCEYVDDEPPPEEPAAAPPPSTSSPSASAPLPSRWRFTIAYDKLVIATGARASTLRIPGVEAHALFLREVRDAQAIRRRLLLNLMKSDAPGLPEAEKRRLLSCVVVGGGPTGVEFSGELSDFIRWDVRSKYAHVKDFVSVTLIEAKEILSSFDVSLRQYAVRQLTKSGVRLLTGTVKEVRPSSLLLSDGSSLPFGLLVWSTGVGPTEFIQGLPLKKSPGGRIAVDDCLRVTGLADVFAAGDCAGYDEATGKAVLPALAQVAERQGRYLAMQLNALGRQGRGRAGSPGEEPGPDYPPFVYRHLGSMATVGRHRALVDLQLSKGSGLPLAGFISWLIWRSAYLTRVLSWRNRLYVAVNWATTLVFGRDVSRI